MAPEQEPDKRGDRRFTVIGAKLLLGFLAVPSLLIVLLARDVELAAFGILSLTVPLLLSLICFRGRMSLRLSYTPVTPDTWGRVWLRCWMCLCIIIVIAKIRIANLQNTYNGVFDERVQLFGSMCGAILFLSSLICLPFYRKLAWFGVVVSIPAMALAFLPHIAKN
jgi:hypothetical protein